MMTLFAPMISRRRKDRSPIFVVAPRRCLPPGRVLPWHKAKPGRKVACLAERLGRRGQDRDGRGDQRPDARHRHQPPGHLILLGAAGDLGIELADLRLQMARVPTITFNVAMASSGQATFRIIDDGYQAGVGRPFGHDLTELRQVAAQGVDRLRSLPDQQLPDPEDHRRPCVSSLFTGTKRIVGR
jgi:hypothetical protein